MNTRSAYKRLKVETRFTNKTEYNQLSMAATFLYITKMISQPGVESITITKASDSLKQEMPNFERIGLVQKQIISNMFNHNWKIRAVHSDMNTSYAELIDEPGGNTYESVTEKCMTSLIARNFFKNHSFEPNLQTTITFFTLSDQTKQLILKEKWYVPKH